jgi:hypothetical protein
MLAWKVVGGWVYLRLVHLLRHHLPFFSVRHGPNLDNK